jgi:hypothetical protein
LLLERGGHGCGRFDLVELELEPTPLQLSDDERGIVCAISNEQ